MITFDYDLDQIIKKSKYWCENIFETSEITPIHILYTIIKDEANIIYNIFWEMGIAMELLTEDLKKSASLQKKNRKINKTFTSQTLQDILGHALKNKTKESFKLNLYDLMLATFEVKNECTPILKTYNISKKEFVKIYKAFTSYEDDFILMQQGGLKNEEEEENLIINEKMSVNVKASEKKDVLDIYCRNLSQLAKEDKLNEIYGRDKEINSCIHILNKIKKRNVLLIGEAGVGKTSIVEGLAHKLTHKKIYELDINKIIAGTKFRGDLEDRIAKLLDRIRNNNELILFIDEAHILKSAGASDDGLSLINVFKPPMARGEIQLILATTNKDYTSHLEDDKALERRCSILHINEPDKKTTLHILKEFSKKNKFNVSDVLLNEIYDFSNTHILNRMMPDKAIDVLDMCYAKEKIKNYDITLEKAEADLKILNEVKIKLFSEGNNELSTQIQVKERELKQALSKGQKTIEISEATLNEIIHDNYQIDKKKLFTVDAYKDDFSWFKTKIIGQDNILNNLIRSYYGHHLSDNESPFNFFFMGNSGMGKTKTVELFAEKYYNSNLFLINCSEYKEAHSISNLIGSPAGYVRSNEGGSLVNYVNNNPYSVILFDEIEEAHRDIYALLLQILDKGVLTDRKNLKANFKNCGVFFTSNIGVKELLTKIGFNKNKNVDKNILESALSKNFDKKFLNRISNICYFNNLALDDYMNLFDDRVKAIRKIFANKISIRIKKATKDAIVNECVLNNLGVRQLNKIINEKIYNYIFMAHLNGDKRILL